MLSSLTTPEKAKGHYHSITLRSSKYWFGKPFLSLKVQLMQQPIWVNCLPIISLTLPFPLYPCGVFNPKEQTLPLLTVLPVCPPIRQETISPETRRKCSLVYSLGLGYHLNKFLVLCLFSFKTVLLGIPTWSGMCNPPASASCPDFIKCWGSTQVSVHVGQLAELYPSPHILSWDRILLTCPGRSWTCNPPAQPFHLLDL